MVSNDKKSENTDTVKTPLQTGGGKRIFQIICSDGSTKGRYKGRKPKQAAKKAFTYLLKNQYGGGKTETGEIEFSIKECTRNSRQKVYNYLGQRVKLEKPIEISHKGNKTVYQHDNKIKKNPAMSQASKKQLAKKNTTKKLTVAGKNTQTDKQVNTPAESQTDKQVNTPVKTNTKKTNNKKKTNTKQANTKQANTKKTNNKKQQTKSA